MDDGYSTDEISRARNYIYLTMKENLKEKGGANFSRLGARDIDTLFHLYDHVFFQDQITDKVLEPPPEEKRPMDLEFIAGERKTGECSIVGVYDDPREYSTNYFIDIAPNILSTIAERVSSLPDDRLKDRLGCLMAIMEHSIIHLLILLYDYNLIAKGGIYAEHGALFQCMSESYFGETIPHDLGFTSVKITTPSKDVRPKTGYAWWSNSCYIDSVLMIMLSCKSNFWRDVLFNTNIETITYPAGTCDVPEIEIKYQRRLLKENARRLQRQFKSDYKDLQDGTQGLKCSNIRRLLGECKPIITSGQLYNSSDLYAVIADLFPDLKFVLPYHLSGSPSKKQKSSLSAPLAVFEMTDFVREDETKEYEWDKVDSNILVFANGGVPRIKDFSTLGREKGYNYFMDQKFTYEIEKVRAFDLTILDGRYELVGVVVLTGVSAHGEGGSHYISYFKALDGRKPLDTDPGVYLQADLSGRWYYYNDSAGGSVKYVENIVEEGIFSEKNRKMPSMYFYSKI
jgi:hypothetical protein